MNRIALVDCTPSSRLLSTAIIDAATDVGNRSHRNPPWQSRQEIEVHASLSTIMRVAECEEFRYRITVGTQTIFGMPLGIDPSLPPGVIKIVDPRSGVSETIEVS